MDAGAAPEALRAVAAAGEAWSDAWAAAGRRLSSLVSVGHEVPGWARFLGEDVVALASAWEGLDRWVGRVGDAFASADAGLIGPPAPVPVRWLPESSPALAAVAGGPTWVDALSDAEATAEALAWGERLAGRAGEMIVGGERAALRSRLFPLWERVRAQWPAAVMSAPGACVVRGPDGLDDALDALLLVGDGRARREAGVWEGLVDGFVAGDVDGEGYDNLGGEVARSAGHLASGLLMFGDARDAVVNVDRHHWGAAALAAVGLIPIAGDLLKGTKSADELVDTARTADRLADPASDVRRAAHDVPVAREIGDLRQIPLDRFFVEGAPQASDLGSWAEAQGWRLTKKNPTSPPTYIDENGIKRMVIKRGSDRTPGSEHPHVSLRDASGNLIDPWGNRTTRNSVGNHVTIVWDLGA